MDTWHHEHNTAGVTVEMHGNVHYLVCPQCHATAPMSAALAAQIRARVPVPCTAPGCAGGLMRFKVMMYDDGEGRGRPFVRVVVVVARWWWVGG